ncbi:Uncharacterised protein [uncultured Ruminococcus sp.]|nr:Uncharacterised protein [uncultured Ruminococcus sp.]
MKIILIDDEPLILEELSYLCEKTTKNLIVR